MYRRLAGLLVVLTMFGAACGDDDEAAETTDTAVAGDATTEDSGSGSAAATDAAFPVTVAHKYGDTVVDAEPQRVVSIGFGEHDGLLALGVVPIAVRDWYGDQPFATWPWAQDELGDAEPEVLPSTELNFEQIAALDPDLIVGVSSGMTAEDYATLSGIAPTIAQPGEYIDYGTPWDAALTHIAPALGRTAEAEQVIAETRQLIADAGAEHPEFAGLTASVSFLFDGDPGAYASQDNRSRLMVDLGFTIPVEYDDLAGDQFYFTTTAEDLSLLDTDVIVWLAGTDADMEALRAMPLRTSTRAFAEGREVFADELLSGALSHSNPLSLEYALEVLVPELALAVDGDPETAVPSAGDSVPVASADEDPAEASEGGTGSSFGAEEQAAADAWTLVFDSTVAIEDKAPHLEGADTLADTLAGYEIAGSALGGISLEPTAVTIEGDVATITYGVLFGGSTAYSDQVGTVSLVDGTWVVSRDEFCSFMASARNDCPA